MKNVNVELSFTVIIACITLYIAFQQYRVQKYQVKNDLYEKRYRVYSTTMQFLDHMIASKNMNQELFRELIEVRNESYFLFDKNIFEKLDGYYKLAYHYDYYCSSFDVIEKDHVPEWMTQMLENYKPSNIDTLVNLRAKVSQYFRDEFYGLKDVFFKYLDFKNMK